MVASSSIFRRHRKESLSDLPTLLSSRRRMKRILRLLHTLTHTVHAKILYVLIGRGAYTCFFAKLQRNGYWDGESFDKILVSEGGMRERIHVCAEAP